jgi:hypothetical protein
LNIDPALVIVCGLLIAPNIAFLRYPYRRSNKDTDELGGMVAASVAFYATAIVLAVAITLPVVLVVATIWGVITGVVIAYAATWPAAMVAYLLVGPPPIRYDWWRPQWLIGRIVVDSLRQRRTALSVRTAVTRTAQFSAAALVLATPQFLVEQAQRPRATAIALGAVLVGYFAALLSRYLYRMNVSRLRIRRLSQDQSLTDEAFLAIVAMTRGTWHFSLLLSWLVSVPSPSLQPCRAALNDLATTLEHVHRMVPKGATARIPRGVWDVCPTFTHVAFRSWLEAYDEKNRGRLGWLASEHRSAIADLVRRVNDLPAPERFAAVPSPIPAARVAPQAAQDQVR